MVPGQGLSLYKGGKEICKSPVKTIVRERKGPKQSIKEYWKTSYRNTILARLILERYIGVKSTKANTGRRNLSYNIVNTIGGKNIRALRRPNKGKKYNSNTPKNGSNRIKRLALLSRCPSR
jgi:hypothetical protein